MNRRVRLLRALVLRPAPWLTATVALQGLALGSLVLLYRACFGAAPSIEPAHHVLVGEVFLLSSGLTGVVVASVATFRVLRELRLPVAALSVAFVCTPCLVSALCQLGAWAMFVGWL